MVEKMAITVMSGCVDRLISLSILTSAAVAMDMEVEIFLQLWGVNAFRKVNIEKPLYLCESKESVDQAVKRMKELNMPMWHELLRQAKDSGKVKIYACSTACEFWGVKKEDLELVDEIIGAGEWIEKCREAKISLYI